MNFTDALEMANWYNQREPKDIGVAAMSRALLARIRELEAALKQVACDCNGEAGCKSYALYYKLCPALETEVESQPWKPKEMNDAEVYEMVYAGNIVGAIKEYRKKSGAGLREAKDHVDGLIKRRRYQSKTASKQGAE